jgi:esterase/lipase
MEKVKFENDRGLELVGNFWSASSDLGIVMAHGFTGTKQQYGKFTRIADELHKAGFNVLSFDFSGCGESEEDSITVEKEIADLESAIRFVKSGGVRKIGLLGLSQGGLVCLNVSDPVVEAIFLMAPPTDALKNYRGKLSGWQREELEEYGLTRKYKPEASRSQIVFSEKAVGEKQNIDQDELLKNIQVPVKIVHGTEDASVPVEQSRRAVEILENAELAEIEDDHYFEDSVEKVAEMAAKFFSEKLPASET